MSSYFDRVTGSNEYERQSWRDSFNGGRAAGDWTGNHNARIEAEREAFQGLTWSGSSSEPSALQFAQSVVGSGPATASVATGGGASGVGPGNPVVSTAPAVETSGPGRQVVVVGGAAPLTAKTKDGASGGYAGVHILPNPWFSDVQDFWEPRMGEPGEWLGGILNVGADAVYNSGRAIDWATGANTVSGQKRERVLLEEQLSMPGHLGSFERQFNTWDRQIHDLLNGDKPYVGGGF